jgi:predicted ATP-dependent protease
MRSLKPEELSRRCDPADIPFATTADWSEAAPRVGHARAVGAIEHALGVELPGYNLYVAGDGGVGKTRFVRDAILMRGKQSGHSDWVYLNRFGEPERPLAIGLPQGWGRQLRSDMARLVDELKATIPAAFESESYTAEVERIQSEITERHAQSLGALNEDAGRDGIALVRTPNGFTLAPVRDNEVMSPEEFGKLPPEVQQRLRDRIGALQDRLQRVVRDGMRLRKEQVEKVRRLDRETTAFTVEHAFEELRARYTGHDRLLAWIETVREDVLDNAEDFLRAGKDAPANPFAGPPDLGRYEVNALSTSDGDEPAPVVDVEHPTQLNLVGRIEHRAQFGTLVTDFRLIRPGALHRANGGYLLIDARRLLVEPFAWPCLKRALERRSIRIESPAEQYGAISTARLEPEPIPLDVKVVLFGDRELYYLLSRFDPDFARLFRVFADFDDDMPRDAEHHGGLARVIASEATARQLLPLGRDAVARVIDCGARLAGDASRVTAKVQRLMEIAVEADRRARGAGHAAIEASDVDAAFDAQRDRAARAQESFQRALLRGSLLIDMTGVRVGQVNALPVHEVAGHLFGHPSRITASTWMGEGNIVDIQRETSLGGPLHTKGVLILSSFLAARYATRRPFTLSASLVFEQSYGPVDGDSATLAEVCALLSSLARLPIGQRLAVTGSMNQLGEVQPVGAINEKIEGFFDACRQRGLCGDQGVIVPAANVDHLMLRDDVVREVAAGRFHVFAVEHVDEAIELLTGVPIGTPGAGPRDATVSGRVAARLREFGELRREAIWPRGMRGNRHGANDGGPHGG